jgi:hypothetical protein
MAPTTVFADSPIAFTDSKGKEVLIPVSALSFSKTGALTVDMTNFGYGKNAPEQTLVVNLLAYLMGQGLIFPAAVAAPKPAMVVSAADPGAAGNNIQVGLKITADASNDPALAKIDVTVTETDSYTAANALLVDPGQPRSIQAVLGSDKAPGTGPLPALVHVIDGSVKAGTLPDASKSPFQLKGSGAAAKSQVPVPAVGGSGNAFTLEAKKPGDENLTTVAVANVDSTKKTFELTAVWTKTVKGYTLSTLGQIGTDFGYLLSVAPPKSGIYLVPAGTGNTPLRFSGGVDGSSPVAASATIFASS